VVLRSTGERAAGGSSDAAARAPIGLAQAGGRHSLRRMDRVETDILVAGGGIAGLSAAAAFAAEGFEVTCVDPVPPPGAGDAEGSDLRSTALLRPSVELLERAGIWPRLKAHAEPLRVMRLADAGGRENAIRTVADFTAAELGVEAFGCNAINWLIRRELAAGLAALPGATLRAPVGVARVVPRSSGALVTLTDESQVRARLLVAADGRDSLVRESLRIGVRRWRYGQAALVFAVSHPVPHEGVSTEIHRTGGAFTLVPLPDHEGVHHSAVVWMETGPRARALAALDASAFEAELNARACGVLGNLRRASPVRNWPIVSQVATRLTGARTALVAEAAHVVPPIGAQGLNMSLRDVATLRDLAVAARAAGRDIGDEAMLERYARARRADVLLRVAGIDALNRAAMLGPRPFRDLRRAGLVALHGLPPLRRAAMRLGLGSER
jgi:2-octaprenyl-6-methoxyphenol hydroxylase